ncbi:MAG: RHS repeat-associated core domain-containing protein, partial [Anaerolineales bacterium]
MSIKVLIADDHPVTTVVLKMLIALRCSFSAIRSISESVVRSFGAGLTQVLSDGTDSYLYGKGRIAQYDPSGAQYFLGDALGSVRQLADVNGEVLLAQSYKPYGDVLKSAGEGTSSYGFAAEMRDPTGLIYLRARYLDTSQGRFISKDVWQGDYANPITYNSWVYGYDNPIVNTD